MEGAHLGALMWIPFWFLHSNAGNPCCSTWTWQSLHFFSFVLRDFWYRVVPYDATMSADIGALTNAAVIWHDWGPASSLHMYDDEKIHFSDFSGEHGTYSFAPYQPWLKPRFWRAVLRDTPAYYTYMHEQHFKNPLRKNSSLSPKNKRRKNKNNL